MKFLIQHNGLNVQNLHKIKTALQDNDLPVQWVGCIPFTEELTSEEPIEDPWYIPYGSTLFTRISQEKRFVGLHYDLEQLNYARFVQKRNDMTNLLVISVGVAIKLLESFHPDTRLFTRPSFDNKQYAGVVMPAKEIRDWLVSMVESGPGSYHIDPDTMIVLDRELDIQAEWRWFIVDGKIISGSMYRAHGQMRVQRELTADVIKEAQEMADIWLPHECVVMDTALVRGTMKVLEFNCINASGFYDHDIGAIFKALYEYHTR